MTSYTLTLLPDRLAVCRLSAGSPYPDWARGSGLVALTRTPDELSVVCDQRSVPSGVQAIRDWRALKVAGPLDFSLVGVLASLASVLAAAGVSLFALSTYDTDYILVRQPDLQAALRSLRRAGHEVE